MRGSLDRYGGLFKDYGDWRVGREPVSMALGELIDAVMAEMSSALCR